MEEIITPQEIKQIRQKLGLPQWKFAIKVGVSPYTVQRWESGKSQPLEVFQNILAGIKKEVSGGSKIRKRKQSGKTT